MSPVPREYQFEAAVETDWRNTWLKITSRKQRQSTLWFTLGFIIFYHDMNHTSQRSMQTADSVQIVRQRMSWLSGLDASELFGVLALRSCTLDHHFLPNNFQNGRQCLRIFECMRCFGHLHDLYWFFPDRAFLTLAYSSDGGLQRDATSQIGGLKIIGIQAGWCRMDMGHGAKTSWYLKESFCVILVELYSLEEGRMSRIKFCVAFEEFRN